MDRLAQYINDRFPQRPGGCYHPIYETVEIFQQEIAPMTIDNRDPALYESPNKRGRPVTRPGGVNERKRA